MTSEKSESQKAIEILVNACKQVVFDVEWNQEKISAAIAESKKDNLKNRMWEFGV